MSFAAPQNAVADCGCSIVWSPAGPPISSSICRTASWRPAQVAEIATAREIVPNVNRISAAVREAGGLVVYIQNTFDDDAVRTWSTFFDHFCSPGAARSG